MTTWGFIDKPIVPTNAKTAPISDKPDPPWYDDILYSWEKYLANPKLFSCEEIEKLNAKRIPARQVVYQHIKKIEQQIERGNLINARRLAKLREWMLRTSDRHLIITFFTAIDREQQNIMNAKPDAHLSKYQLGGRVIGCTAGMKLTMELHYVGYADIEQEFTRIKNHMAVVAEQYAINSEEEELAKEHHARCLEVTMKRAWKQHAEADARKLDTAKRAERHAKEREEETAARRRKSAAERSGTKSIASPRPKRMPE